MSKTGCDFALIQNICRRKSKVTNFHVVVRVQENIYWLQVPMDHSLLMNVYETFHNFSKQSPDSISILVQPVVDGSPARCIQSFYKQFS